MLDDSELLCSLFERSLAVCVTEVRVVAPPVGKTKLSAVEVFPFFRIELLFRKHPIPIAIPEALLLLCFVSGISFR